MASSSAVARLRELTTAAELSGAGASALAECCADLLRPGGGDAEAALPALDALCAASASAAVGEAMRRHADDLAPLVVARLGDADAAVREAARRFLVALMEMKEMNARMENAEPPSCIPNVHHSHYVMIEMEPSDTNQAKKSPKEKISTREISILAGEGDMTKKSVEPIKVFSEKDLVREIEKVSSTLQPDKEWSIRLTAMQRVEGLVLGGAVEYSAFPMLLKQLVTPLITQLLDRRSSIVKQACHLLSFLSKELLRDFEPCAELLIPVLLKNVVITILVIADSADNCIKEMLQNCKVARILPRIIEFAKNDRSAVLRARCCEYAIMMLECWVDTPEIQRSADLYEELIKCCIEDATNEVRSSARACYRIFSKIWPERSCQLFSSFETSRQKMINDEDAEMHLKHSPADRTKSRQPQSSSYIPTSTGYGSQVVSAMDKVVNIDSRMLSSGVLPSLQGKPALQSDDMTLKSPVKDRRDVSSAIGNTFEDMSTLEKDRTPVEDPENCDSGVTSSSTFHLPSPALLAPEPPTEISLSDAAIITIVQDKVECRPNVEQITPQQAQAPWDPSELPNLSPPVSTKEAGNLLKKSSVKVIPMTSSSTAATLKNPVKVASDANSGRRYGTQQVKRCISSPNRGVVPKERNNNYTPNFQRPLLSKQMTNWFFASTRSDLDDKQLILGEMVSNMDVPSTLTEALSLGLNPRSDWMMRVYAFNFLQSLLQRGAKGIQEVLQNFEKVMRLVSRYLDDPHHKVAQAALSSLAEIISVFKKSFEHYLDKMLPHVFSQLNDPKESIRQQCSEILKLAGEHYSIDFLLPALLRSLDEQKSPKSKLAVLEFANASFSKCTVNSDSYSSSSFLKPWLGKLALLFKDKNNKLKEVAIGGFSLIYSHYDPASVLSFIVSLSMEEQKRLRRAMKQLIPAIDSDLEKFLQQRRQKQKMPSYDPFTAIGQPFAKGFIGKQTKPQLHPACPADSTETDDVFSSAQQCLPIISQRISFEVHEHPTGKIEFESSDESGCHKVEDMGKNSSTTRSWSSLPRTSDYNMVSENAVESPSKDTCNLKSCEESNASGLSIAIGNKEVMRNNCQEDESSVSQMQHEGIMNQRDEVPETNGHSLSIKNLHQMTSSLLEMLDDQNESAKELALSLLVEILEKQAKAMEHCVETLIVKLLYATKDAALKVVNQAHICLSTVVTQFDPQRCLGVIVSQLVCKDEKLLIISINSLSKIVIRLSQDDLMTHLSTFLPALLDAFENHSPYVRKVQSLPFSFIYINVFKISQWFWEKSCSYSLIPHKFLMAKGYGNNHKSCQTSVHLFVILSVVVGLSRNLKRGILVDSGKWQLILRYPIQLLGPFSFGASAFGWA